MFQTVLVILVIGYASCGNILILQDVPSPSHSIWTTELAIGLAKKGHNVTRLGSDCYKKQERINNYHVIYLEGILESVHYLLNDTLEATTYKRMTVCYEFEILSCKKVYQTKGLQQLLDYPENFKFDAIVTDMTISCLLPLIKRFNFPPTVGVTAFLFPYYLAMDFGNTIEPSHIPGFLLSLSDNMNFFDRLANYFWISWDIFLRKYYLKTEIQKLAVERFGESVGDLENMRRHISLLLVNVENTLHYPRQLAPNVIPVGGLHIQRAGQLPQDLQKILDNAKNGAILFSFGTYVTIGSLKPEIRTAMFEAIAKLNQTVIFKSEINITNVPSNIIIRQWVPQPEILAHPNTRLFISHGGGLGTMEAAYFGVPVLGVPFIIDQFTNIVMMENRGIARQVDYTTITPSTLYNSITEMLNNPVYAENMNKISNRMRDQSQTPLERAVYWIEYSMRHNGTHFLNLKSRDLPLAITSGLDIQLFMLLIFCVILLVTFLAYRYFVKYIASLSKIKKQ